MGKMLEGKVALITGASRGIGKAVALRFAAEGADIAFTHVTVSAAFPSNIFPIIYVIYKVNILLIIFFHKCDTFFS